MSEHTTIQKVKPGDSVAYEARRFDLKLRSTVSRWHVTTVERVMATAIVTKDGRRWSIKNGKEHGVGAASLVGASWLREATPERVQLAADADERERLATRLFGTEWRGLDLATLRRVMLALEGEQ
jgi:hypothetical protein